MLLFKQKKSNQEDVKKNALQNPKILEVNLIKGEFKILFDWNKNISLLIITLFIVGLFIAEIYYGLGWWKEQELSKSQYLNDNISSVNNEIAKIKGQADDALKYQSKATEVSRLLDKHVYWSNFFNWLEKNTLNTVKFSDFSGDTSGVYSLSAQASSYAEVSWQVKAFLNDPLVKKVNVDSVSASNAKGKSKAESKNVSFSLSFELNPDIFKK